MKLFLVGLLICVAADADQQWTEFKERFGKVYNDISDEMERFEIFKANVDFIKRENAKDAGYTLAINQFTDLTNAEFRAQYTGLKQPSQLYGSAYLGRHEYSGKDLDDTVDWTTKGAVTPVKNQGSCGSCWAFSSTGALEGRTQIATGKLVSMSEQQFVDCEKQDQGCGGGEMDNAFKYAETAAVCTEASYSYKGKNGNCKASSCTPALQKGQVTGYKDVAKNDMQALMEAVAEGPVSIAVDGATIMQLYFGGIIKGPCLPMLDHGVLAVGYGTDNGQKYWKVKNSWGATWGEKGYCRLLRGKGGPGECGLLAGPPSYPVIAKSKSVVV